MLLILSDEAHSETKETEICSKYVNHAGREQRFMLRVKLSNRRSDRSTAAQRAEALCHTCY